MWELDQLQYVLGEGPCLHSMAHEQTTVVEHARHEPRWPRFIKEAVKRRLRSQLALQLYFDEWSLAGPNMYSTRRDTLDEDTVDAAELVATHAAIALGKVREDRQPEPDTEDAEGDRSGHRYREGALRRHGGPGVRVPTPGVSSTENVKLRVVAQQLVDDTEGTAEPLGLPFLIA